MNYTNRLSSQKKYSSDQMLKALAAPNLHETILKILHEMKNHNKLKVLDAGAGQGALSNKLHKMGFKVSACDVDDKQFLAPRIKCKKSNLNIKFPYKDNTFDIIIALELIEHLENPWNFVREARRVLKHNGLIFLSTPNVSHISSRIFYLLFGTFLYFWSERYRRSNGHINPLFIWELKNILASADFKIRKILYNEGKLISLFKPFIKNRRLFLGTPISFSYLPKNSLFGENVIFVAQKVN